MLQRIVFNFIILYHKQTINRKVSVAIDITVTYSLKNKSMLIYSAHSPDLTTLKTKHPQDETEIASMHARNKTNAPNAPRPQPPNPIAPPMLFPFCFKDKVSCPQIPLIKRL